MTARRGSGPGFSDAAPARRGWLALLGERPAAADAAALASGGAGWLCFWLQSAKPHRSALRVDPRVVDPTGAPATVSLVLPPPEWLLPVDDPAVQQARRDIIAATPAPDVVSLLLRDASHFAGSITAWRGMTASRLAADDPFARLAPRRIFVVDEGALGQVAPPVGPVIERYGSEQPWPADRFGG